MRDERHLLVKTAVLYYKYDMNQPLIAEKLGLSRQKVGRLLKQAKDMGIVKISIQSELTYSTELAAALEELFDLKEAIVVDVPVYEEQVIKEEIGKAAAELLARILVDGDSLSISWSSTVYQCARNLGHLSLSGMKFSQLNGSHEKVPYIYSGMNILNLLNQCVDQSVSYPLLAPLKVNSEGLLSSLLKDDTIQRAMQAAVESRIALFGIGSISQASSLFQAGYMDAELVNALQSCGAVADVCGHFLDGNGLLCNQESEKRTLAISEMDLKRKEYSIALAGETTKAKAILGALKGSWCNVLVTDVKTAEQVIQEMKATE
jgi:deoxyribonucleoside regulator